MKTPEQRWEDGDPHHPAAEWLALQIGDHDLLYNNDANCYKFGGDGDNGEELCYLLSMIFENKNILKQFKKLIE